MDIELHALGFANSSMLTKDAAESVYWQMPLDADGIQSTSDDPEFDKQLWIQRVLLEWGICGYTVTVGTGHPADGRRTAGTVFFAPPNFVPGVETMPAGPVSPDAILLTTTHVDMAYMGLYLEHELINAVLGEASRRGVHAVEVYGRDEDALDELLYSEPALLRQARPEAYTAHPSDDFGGVSTLVSEYGEPALSEIDYDMDSEAYGGWRELPALETGNAPLDALSTAPMVSVDVLEELGFHRVGDHPLYPRYRKEIQAGSPFGDRAEDSYRSVDPDWHPGTAIGGSAYGRKAQNSGVWSPQGPWDPWGRAGLKFKRA